MRLGTCEARTLKRSLTHRQHGHTFGLQMRGSQHGLRHSSSSIVNITIHIRSKLNEHVIVDQIYLSIINNRFCLLFL